jgi:transcriptional regulator with XRE-family HTH domain
MTVKREKTEKTELAVVELRRVLLKSFGNNQKRMAGELEVHPSHLNKVLRGTKPVSDELLKKVHDRTGVLITRAGHVVAEPEAEPTKPEKPTDRLLAFSQAANALTHDDIQKLEQLVTFRTSDMTNTVPDTVEAIQAIIGIRSVLDV